MRVRLTASANADLESIALYLSFRYPAIAPRVEQRIRTVIAHIADWPESAPRVIRRTDIRSMPVRPYPYRIYFRIRDDVIEIVRIRHTAQRPLRGF
jgi:toxin ParE1/3/4